MTLTEKRIKALSRGVSSTLAKLTDDVSLKRVHRLRTGIRRIQSAVDYTRPKLGRRQQDALDDLSKLRRRAGKVRDLDVQIDLLSGIGNGSAVADRRMLEGSLRAKRGRQAQRLQAAARKLERANFAGSLGRLAAAVSAAGDATSQPDTPVRHAQKRIADLAGQHGAQSQLKPKRLHEVRIALKMVRYLAELGEESEEQQRLLQRLKSVQDALGEWHDWEELLRTAEKLFRHRANCPILDEVRALYAARFAASLSAVSRLFMQHAAAPSRRPPRSVPSRAMVQRA